MTATYTIAKLRAVRLARKSCDDDRAMRSEGDRRLSPRARSRRWNSASGSIVSAYSVRYGRS